MIYTLLYREVKLALRAGLSLMTSLVFILLFITLFAIGVDGNMRALSSFGTTLIWCAYLFAALLSAGRIFHTDYEDATLEQILLAGVSPYHIIISKALSFMIITLIPLLLALIIAMIWLGLEQDMIIGLYTSLIIATPAITAYVVLCSAFLMGAERSGFLIIILAMPFLIPILIFALAGAQSFASHGIFSVELRALLGLDFIGIAIALPASAHTLKTYLEAS